MFMHSRRWLLAGIVSLMLDSIAAAQEDFSAPATPGPPATGDRYLDLRQSTDRTLQRYADGSERTSEHPTPTAGDLSFLEDTGDLDVYFSGAWRHVGDSVGTIKAHAGGAAPTGWLVCDGAAISRTTYAALFAQIGEIWGVGDGSTTFNKPDLRGRVPRGVAASGTGDAVGETFGSDTHTHNVDPPPTNTDNDTHNHSVDPPSTQTGTKNVGTDIVVNTGAGSFVTSINHEHPVDIAPFNSANDIHNHQVNIAQFASAVGSHYAVAGAAVVMLIKT